MTSSSILKKVLLLIFITFIPEVIQFLFPTFFIDNPLIYRILQIMVFIPLILFIYNTAKKGIHKKKDNQKDL